MRILVSGASGLVGSALVEQSRKAGADLRAMDRDPSGQGVHWNVETGELDQAELRRWGRPDVIIHLAGESIASSRWTEERKARIRDSRVKATQALSAWLVRNEAVPPVFISASAVGYYGDRGDEILTEESPAGRGFLGEVARDWEDASKSLAGHGCRLVWLRFGMILSREGGALAKMLPPFKLGLGGPAGSGRQWVSWIALSDVIRVIDFVVNHEISGPLNCVAPEPVQNCDFAAALGAALHRPAIVPAPAPALRVLLGEMADALLLSSQRAVPARLTAAGFRFEHNFLPQALRAVLQE